ncbi:MAG: CGGC domain-containing protein [Sporomusaceae bacterium]|nr:CGGC domain-containing protein [Sporomusaceae bacterium]
MVRLGILGYSKLAAINGEVYDLAKAAQEAKGVFKELGPVELVGCVTCNGYPGKRIIDGARLLAKWGADIIAFSAGGKIGAGEYSRHNERILKELSEQMRTTIIIDCGRGIGV